MVGGNLKTQGDLKERSLVSLGKQKMSFQLIFMNNDTNTIWNQGSLTQSLKTEKQDLFLASEWQVIVSFHIWRLFKTK